VPKLSFTLALLALALPAIAVSESEDEVVRQRSRRVEFGSEVTESGLSPIKAQRLYVTRDGGRTWGRPIPQPPQGPVVWEASEDGPYGFTLCAVDAVGNAQSGPVSGDLPQVSLLIDTRPPAVSLKAEPGRIGEPLRFTWNARDEDGVAAVGVEASRDGGGTWKEIARGSAMGEGSLPPSPAEVLLKAVAVDLAGNRGSSRVLSLRPEPPLPVHPPVRHPVPEPVPVPIHIPEPEPVPEPSRTAHEPIRHPAPEPEPTSIPPVVHRKDLPHPYPETPVDEAAAAVHFSAATLYRLNGKVPQAEAEYHAALAANPRHIQALNDLGILLFRVELRKDEGLLLLERARLLSPGDPDVAFNLGYALLASGHPAEAVSHLTSASEGLQGAARIEAERLLNRARKEAP